MKYLYKIVFLDKNLLDNQFCVNNNKTLFKAKLQSVITRMNNLVRFNFFAIFYLLSCAKKRINVENVDYYSKCTDSI